MPRDKRDSHIRVLQAAREEFLDCGYMGASMRRIGQRSGMTAAALYRHCKDKSDLFEQVVRPAVTMLNEWTQTHIRTSLDALQDNTYDLFQNSEIDLMREVVYPHCEEFRLLLTRAQGTPYENFFYSFVEQNRQEMLHYLPVFREKGFDVQDLQPEELHLLLYVYLTALFEPVMRGCSEQEALHCLDTLKTFFLPGWMTILGLTNKHT